MPEQTTGPAQPPEPLSDADSPEPLGRLMIYLFCVASCIESKIFDDYITDYKQFASLSLSQTRTVLAAAHDLSPQALSAKIIRDVGEGVGDNFVHATTFNPPYRKELVVLGRTIDITFKKILCCSAAWRAKFYETPIHQPPVDVFKTMHCSHCLGAGDACSCSECERFSWSYCWLPGALSGQDPGALSTPTQLQGASQISSEYQRTPTAYHYLQAPGGAVRTSGDLTPFSSTSEASALYPLTPSNPAPSVQGPGALSISTQRHPRDPTWLAHRQGGTGQTMSGYQHTPTADHCSLAPGSTSGDSAPLSSTSKASALYPLTPSNPTSVGERSPTTPRQSQYEPSETSDATSDRTETFYQFQAETLSQTTMAIQSSEGSTDSLHPEPMPCIIVVMGPTGSGKSTFISEAIGRNVGVGHTLTSCTEEIKSFHVPRDIIREDMEVILVDTPGFDDTNKPDYEIFEKVAKWLKTEMENEHGIAGLIYIHRISDNRMAGTPLKTLNMFRELCGKKMMTSVVLMTSMWPNVPETQAVPRMQEDMCTTAQEPMPVLEQREEELRGKYFKEFIRLGATLTRFGNNQASVAEILGPLVRAWSLKEDEERLYRVVRLQKEVKHYGLDIRETSAAREIYGQLQSIIEEQRNILVRVDNLVAGAVNGNPDDLAHALQDLERVIGDLVATQEAAAQLRLPLTGRLKVFVSKIQRMFHPVIARQRQLSSRIKHQISLKGIQEGDKVIIVAGVTGSGMSTFISRALGEDVGMRRAVSAIETGNNTGTVMDNRGRRETPKSWTRDVKYFRSSKSKIVFVDTPGFDNDEQALSNLVIRNKITYVVENLPTKAKFSGFIFLQNAAKPSCTLNLLVAINDFSEPFRKTFMTAVVVAIFKEKQKDVSPEMQQSVGKLSFPVEVFSDNRDSVKAVLKQLLDQKTTVIQPTFSTGSLSVRRIA